MRSQAATQLLTGPAHTIGVPPMNRMSPVKTAFASATCTSVSPPVCAGPTSMTSTSRPPTSTQIRPVKVLVGVGTSMPSNPNWPKRPRTKGVRTGPRSVVTITCIISGVTSAISSAVASDAMTSAPVTSWLP